MREALAHVVHEPAEHELQLLPLPPDTPWAANVENIFSVFFAPHPGQAGAGAGAELLRTSISKTRSHFEHLYS